MYGDAIQYLGRSKISNQAVQFAVTQNNMRLRCTICIKAEQYAGDTVVDDCICRYCLARTAICTCSLEMGVEKATRRATRKTSKAFCLHI